MAKDIFMQAQLTNIPIIHVNLIKRFPTEIVSLIVKLLSPADVMNAREVCPEWQKKIDASITNTNIVKDFTFSHRINEAYIKNPSKAYLESQSFKIECLTQNYYYLHEASSNRHDVRVNLTLIYKQEHFPGSAHNEIAFQQTLLTIGDWRFRNENSRISIRTRAVYSRFPADSRGIRA